MVESVDTLDSKSGEHYARAGSSPARGTNKNSSLVRTFFIHYFRRNFRERHFFCYERR